MKNYRPGYHFRPKENWMNDPCGLIYHEGEYHLYYQYNPHGDVWGDMHWGHAVSRDMVDWEARPIALTPDAANGEAHCFTGSAYHMPDGRAAFLYTSISPDREPEQWHAWPQNGSLDRLVQTRENALTADMHGAELALCEWRDPNVLEHGGGYLMVTGGRVRHADGQAGGAALLYTSADGEKFAFHGVLAGPDNGEDESWECTNFFRMGDLHVLIYSPYRKPEYIAGRLTDDLRFVPVSRGVVDEGGHEGFYAPQVFSDGTRTIMMGWMPERAQGAWRGVSGWAGMMTLPREVYMAGGVLKMRVIPEAERLVTSTETGDIPFADAHAGEQYRLVIDAKIAPDGCVRAEVLASPDGRERTVVALHGDGRFTVDRRESSLHPTHKGLLERRVTIADGAAHVEIYVDHSAVEACANGEWITARVYPALEDSVGLSVTADKASGTCTVSQMRDCEK